ncbi:hypothetical protein VAWG005_06710 [Aeromonas dhakensis]|nr:hypothetical protein VAWG003_06670 [Aeromonas dhakensis]BEE24743.1 hypothetical protein VAWG005_06710 [Aeromonas dhakensis]
MGFERAKRQFAALLGEHAELANQIARQGAQGAGIHIRASYLVVINNQYSQLVVTSNFFYWVSEGSRNWRASRAGTKKGPRGAQTLETRARARIPSLVRQAAGER